MEAIDPRGVANFGPHRLDWQDLCREPLDIDINCGPLWFKRIFKTISLRSNLFSPKTLALHEIRS